MILQTKTYLFFLHKNISEGRLPSVVQKTRRIASLFPLGPVFIWVQNDHSFSDHIYIHGKIWIEDMQSCQDSLLEKQDTFLESPSRFLLKSVGGWGWG